MKDFSQQRFIEMGQSIYLNWTSSMTGLGTLTEKERRDIFNTIAEYAFEATEEFAKVFRSQEEQ